MSAIVQGPLSASTSSNPSSFSKAFSSNVTSGNTVLVMVQAAQGVSVTSSTATCADGLGNTYTLDVSGATPASGANEIKWWIFSAPVTTGGACTPNVTFSSSPTRAEIIIYEISGLDNASLVDAVLTTATGTGTAMSAGTLTTSTSGFLLAILQTVDNYVSVTPGSGWTGITGSIVYSRRQLESRITGASGSYTANATAGSSVNWGAIAVAYKDGATGATAVTMSGPSSGTAGSASTNFTIGANGTITGTVVVTPADGGAGGTFTPTTVSISSGTPTATFTYTASSAGAKTISVTNNGSLSNPSNITYTASAAAATAVTLSGPSSGTVLVASSNFTVGANGAITGTVVVTPSDSGDGGTFTPTTVSISSGSPTGTFTYTPATTGVKSISTSDNGGLTDPTPISYTSNAAGGVKGSNFFRYIAKLGG